MHKLFESLIWIAISNHARLSILDAKTHIPRLHKKLKEGDMSNMSCALQESVVLYDDFLRFKQEL